MSATLLRHLAASPWRLGRTLSWSQRRWRAWAAVTAPTACRQHGRRSALQCRTLRLGRRAQGRRPCQGALQQRLLAVSPGRLQGGVRPQGPVLRRYQRGRSASRGRAGERRRRRLLSLRLPALGAARRCARCFIARQSRLQTPGQLPRLLQLALSHPRPQPQAGSPLAQRLHVLVQRRGRRRRRQQAHWSRRRCCGI